MELTNTEIKIVVKNMAREMVKKSAAKNAALREVAVTYSDGTTITTSMAAHLSDADIKNYFRVGQEFNLGSGGKDKMVKVKSVKILNAMAKNAPLSDMWNKENDLFRKGDDVVFRGKGRGLIQGRIKDIQGNTYIISSGEGEYRLTKEDLKGSSKH